MTEAKETIGPAMVPHGGEIEAAVRKTNEAAGQKDPPYVLQSVGRVFSDPASRAAAARQPAGR